MAWFRETKAGAVVLACVILLLSAASAEAAPPQVIASWVTEVTATSALLHGEVIPGEAEIEYHFEYVTEAAFQKSGFDDAMSAPGSPAKLASGVTVKTVTQKLVGPLYPLAPATAYHYRLVTTVGGDTIVGPEHVLVTEGIGRERTLPDGRAWEMVSPVDKNGGGIAGPEELFGGGDLQASAAPGAITYGSSTAFGDAVSAPPASQYVSRRSTSGWQTQNVSAPVVSAAYGDNPDGVPYRLFSSDLARAILFGGPACRGALPGCPAPNPPLAGSGAPAGYMAYYLRSAAGFTSLLTAADVSHSGVSPANLMVGIAAASPDLSRVILTSCAALTANAIEAPGEGGKCDPEGTNLYEWSAGGLTAINLLPGETETTPGASIAAPVAAVAATSSRVYWNLGGDLYLREGDQTVPVSVGGTSEFQSATPGGSIAFFTKGGHLQRFQAVGQAVQDLTPGGGVVGMLASSGDGSYAYYQDASGLRQWHLDATREVAPGADATTASDYPPATATARVSADGRHLAFLSERALTGFDNVDAKTNEPDAQLYVFDSTATGEKPSLACASCNPTGERPEGPATIPGALVNGSSVAYRPRPLSADGSRLFFETSDGISDNDTNGGADVYEWEAEGASGCEDPFGCVAPISRDGGVFLDASADATDVYFLTDDSLVGVDPGSVDVYDARVGGGLPEPSPKGPCVGDSCQPLPGEPDDPTPGTLVPNPGNPRLRIFGPRKPKKHHGHRHHRRHRAKGHRGKRRHHRGREGER